MVWAGGMYFTTRAELLAAGRTDEDIRGMVRLGHLTRLGRGRYSSTLPDGAEARHLAMARFEDEAVLTLETAALVHGLAVAKVPPSLQLALTGQRNRLRGRGRQVRGDSFESDEVVIHDGFTVTSLTRTMVDLARVRSIDEAIIAWESALGRARGDRTLGHFQQEVSIMVRRSAGRHGSPRARELAHFASAYSESPKESTSRLLMSRMALPQPVQQFEVVDFDGNFLGRTDFAWPELGVLGEYDGQDKYSELARPGEKPHEVLRREKRRQERMESLGWIVVRWGKEEVAAPSTLFERLRRALRNGHHRGLGGSLPGRVVEAV